MSLATGARRTARVTIVRSRAVDAAPLKLAATLASFGYDVRVLLWDRSRTFKPEADATYDVRTFRLRAPYDRIAAILALPFWWVYVVYQLVRHPPSVVQACDFDTLVPARIARLFRRFKIAYFVYDMYGENLPGRIPARLRGWITTWERSAMMGSDAVFIVDDSRLSQLGPDGPKDVHIIYNSPPDQGPPGIGETAANARLRLFYAGNLHESRGLAKLTEVVRHRDDVVLVLYGSGPLEETIARIARENPTRIQFRGWAPYSEILRASSEADVLVAFYDPSIPNNLRASPNKLFEAMMLGKPIITNEGTAASSTVLEVGCGALVPFGDVAALNQALDRLQDPRLRSELGRRGRTAYLERYDWRIMTERLKSAYANLLGPPIR